MKPLKFRVWDKLNNEWSKLSHNLDEEGNLKFNIGSHAALEICNINDYEVSYSTGVFDSSGKEIFFYDFLYYYDLNHKKCLGHVVFLDSMIKFKYIDGTSRHIDHILENYNVHIFSNKYENQELLNE
jgi:hypothetical protein